MFRLIFVINGRNCVWNMFALQIDLCACPESESRGGGEGGRNRMTLTGQINFSIHFPAGSHLEHRAPFGVSVITHTILDIR
jgi:hypothetical protein